MPANGQLPAMAPMPANGQLPAMQPMPANGQLPGRCSPSPARAFRRRLMQPAPMPATDSSAAPQSQRLQGRLVPGSQTDAQGRLFAVHEMTFHRGQRVTITLESAEFDTVLRVEPPAGEAIENDDVAPPATNSRVDFTAPIDGRYRVVATTYAPNMAGAYTGVVQAGAPGQGLTVVTGAQPGPDAQVGAGGTLTANAPVREYLSPGDPSSGGRFVRSYRIEGRAGDMVRLRLESTAFDPTLALVSANGQRWYNDDTTQHDTNSTVQVTLPAAGSYRVEVSSYRPGETGPFTLTMGASARPVVGPNGAAPSSGIAGRRGEGTMYGVFVGITDYGGRGNLYGCADDARQLAQAYINARLGGAAQFIVLTDAEATTGAVRNAFSQMAGRVGPNDVFMFFHSGHGNRHPSQDRAADPDGFVETIVLRDGEVNAHEMSQLFNTVRADVGMLALDSCYSGGFARAFGSAPNRFGMYSSEEDVLSQVAQRYQAGGYLSYFLRRGVTEGDANRDSALRAGELADYLQRQFAQNLDQMRTQDGQDTDTWQHLVINRTSVALSDMLWRFPQVGGGG
ncbi:MAG: pre-peptidase C-terminal domain-containing protein [Polyangiales bacterium]